MNLNIKTLFIFMLSLAAACPAFATRTRTSREDKVRAKKLMTQGAQEMKFMEYSRAVAFFERATYANPRSAEAFAQMGSAYYHEAFRRGTPEKSDKRLALKALDAYKAALAVDPKLRKIKDAIPISERPPEIEDRAGSCQRKLA